MHKCEKHFTSYKDKTRECQWYFSMGARKRNRKNRGTFLLYSGGPAFNDWWVVLYNYPQFVWVMRLTVSPSVLIGVVREWMHCWQDGRGITTTNSFILHVHVLVLILYTRISVYGNKGFIELNFIHVIIEVWLMVYKFND